MPSEIDRVLLPYKDAEQYIINGDLLFYAGTGIVSAPLIRIGTLSQYAHVGMAGWSNGDPANPYSDLMAYEMVWTGGQGSKLESHLSTRKFIDVYRVSDTHTKYTWNVRLKQVTGHTAVLDRNKAVQLMRRFCRPGEYGSMHLLWTALTRLPLLRFFFSQPTDDQLSDRSRPPYCSEAVAYALRHAFTDTVINTPDHYTTPGAIACSPLLHYLFTLVP